MTLNGPVLPNSAFSPQYLAVGLTVSILGIGCLVLVFGWGFGIDALVRLHPAWPAMVPMTAGCIIGLSVAILVRSLAACAIVVPRILDVIIRAVLAAIILSTTWSIVTSFTEQTHAQTDQMSRATAAGLLCLALSASAFPFSVATLMRRNKWRYQLGVGAASVTFCLTIIALIGFIFDQEALRGQGLFKGLALHTSLCLLMLSIATLIIPPAPRWVAILWQNTVGGRMVRRALPVAILGPVFLCFIALRVTESGILNPNIRLAALAAGMAILSGLLSIRAGRFHDIQFAANLHEERRLKDALNGLQAAVFVFDRTGGLQLTNLAADKLVGDGGSAKDWLLREHFHDLSDRHLLSGPSHPMTQLMQSATATDLFAGWRDRQGAEHAFHFSVAHSDLSNRLILTITDETQGWLLRENLSRTERMNAIGQMAGGIAHELANILGVVRLSSDTAQLLAQEPTVAHQLTAIQSACDRGGDLANRLLDLSRAPSDTAPRSNPLTIIQEAVALLSPALPPSITLTTQLPDTAPNIALSATDFQGAVLNLVLNARNAIKDTNASGVITLSLWVDEASVHMRIQDDGPGMNDSVLARATEPFFTTRTGKGGTGLGLSMIDMRATQLGGTFTLRNLDPVGFEATLTLPHVINDPLGNPQNGADDLPSLPVDLTGLRIMMVEDDPHLHNVMDEALRSLGAHVIRAQAALPALEQLEHLPELDLLLTDIILPGDMDGHALAAKVVQRYPGLPVIYLSGYTDPLSRNGRVVPGLVLRKPVDLITLANTLALSLPQRAQAERPAIST
ncbi:hypothetical protein BFP70_15580 [Thioclava sp. SK-1]|uniref:ATP-binding protein n=1 Tax=Thioclava sp. SK-1 TaxID=1889770 RepID=UPI000826F077|nr:ATP-binding protein [Thioclava sp. SK-1]OCX61440.1 hypothetical protein BFP70_15580 [Thioclava sp. SK-1]